MAVSLDFHTLRRAYASGAATPASIVREVISRATRRGNDSVWIARVPEEVLIEEAAALVRRAATAGTADLPLYGLPFAVKDNIDVAGLPTTAACPGFSPIFQKSRRRWSTRLRRCRRGSASARPISTSSPPGWSACARPMGCRATRSTRPISPVDRARARRWRWRRGWSSFALGTDTAGSGRVPAAFNNIVGLKPTRGLSQRARGRPGLPLARLRLDPGADRCRCGGRPRLRARVRPAGPFFTTGACRVRRFWRASGAVRRRGAAVGPARILRQCRGSGVVRGGNRPGRCPRR